MNTSSDYIQRIARFRYSILFLPFLLISSVHVRAQGNLLINPKRIIFDGQARSQEVNLVNIGKDTSRYAVSFIQYKMKSDGSIETITQPDPGQNFADKYLRIFPRTVTLGPNEAQIVKVQLMQTKKLLPGEYRSHLYFRAISGEKPLAETESEVGSNGLSVRLTAVFGISIPVIIRSGESTAKVNLSNLQLERVDSIPHLKARFTRTGNMSVYGDVTIEHISKEGQITRVALVKGLSVYTPNASRDISIKLNKEGALNYHSGKLRVLFASSSEGEPEKLATAELLLN